nr:hypothetical protein [uncultured Carboxylicivirga sp.]
MTVNINISDKVIDWALILIAIWLFLVLVKIALDLYERRLKKRINQEPTLDITEKSINELAKEYEVSPRTFEAWIDKKGFPIGERSILKPFEVKQVYDYFGIPKANNKTIFK